MNILVDLDATLAHYDQWRGFEHIGEPIMPMVNVIKALIKDGHSIKIFTARADLENPDLKGITKEQIFKPIEDWCEKYLGQKLEITNKKTFDTTLILDDRAVQIMPNVGLSAVEYFEQGEHLPLLRKYSALEAEHNELLEKYDRLKEYVRNSQEDY